MPRKIFVNLPCKDLPKSIEFFTKLGFTFNPQFTDETATCMIVSDTISVMLHTHAKFKEFIPLPIADARKATEVILAVEMDSRAQVEDLLKKAFANGATKYAEPKDYGWMYYQGFQDLDGHIWELLAMTGEPPKA